MWPFGSKPSGSRGIPTSRVMSLSSQGMSEPDIISALRNEGFTPSEVDSAMRQALRGSVGGRPAYQQPRPAAQPSPMPQRPPGPPLPPDIQSGANPWEMSPPMPPSPDEAELEPPRMPRMPSQDLGLPPLPGDTEIPDYQFPPEPPQAMAEEPIQRMESNSTRKEAREERRRAIEEMVEGIVEEKWNRFLTDAEEIRGQFSDLQNKIMLLEQSIKRLEDDKQTELGKIEGKIDTYKQSMGEVSSRMEAVEGALKNSMTPMMQSIRSLTDAVKSIKSTRER